MEKRTVFLVTIQPEVANAKPEQRVYTNSQDLCNFLSAAGTTVIVSEVTLYE